VKRNLPSDGALQLLREMIGPLKMKPSEVMAEYLKLSEAEQRAFDRLYTGRATLQRLYDLIAKAKPEQLPRMKAAIDKWGAGLTSDAAGTPGG
jgi:hypothetical protein